jgi:hypothetical protein
MTAVLAEDGHDRPLCGATRKGDRPPCALPAGWGTAHPGFGPCRKHLGNTPAHVAAARKEEARRAVAFYGLPREIDPQAALLEELHRTAGHVSYIAYHVANELEGEPWSVRKHWLERYDAERDHMTAVAEKCHRAGIEDRLTSVSEQHADQLATMVRALLVGLGHDPSDPAVMRVVRRTLNPGSGNDVVEGG